MNRQEKRKLTQHLKRKKFNNTSFETMLFEDFLLTPRFPYNRDEERRMAKPAVKKKFTILLDVHCYVVIGVLTEDCEYAGIKYKEGDRFRLDGNTRAEFWESGKSDFVPEELLAGVVEAPNMEIMKMRYYTFDSVTSVEITAEKITGAMINAGMKMKSEKLAKGQIALALNYACFGMYPTEFAYKPSETRDEDIEKKVSLFKEEIMILDEIVFKRMFANQSLFCAFLMMLKLAKMKKDDSLEKIKTIISDIGRGKATTGECEMNGVTHIVEEIKGKNNNQPKSMGGSYFGWGTTYKVMMRQISFVIYWMNKELTGVKGQQYPNVDSEKEYKDFHEKHDVAVLLTEVSIASSNDASYFDKDKFAEDVNSITPFLKIIDEEQSNENILN